MEENNNSDYKGLLLFLLNAGIVFLIYILLTNWLITGKYSNQGGGDIARWGGQGALYFIQVFLFL